MKTDNTIAEQKLEFLKILKGKLKNNQLLDLFLSEKTVPSSEVKNALNMTNEKIAASVYEFIIENEIKNHNKEAKDLRDLIEYKEHDIDTNILQYTKNIIQEAEEKIFPNLEKLDGIFNFSKLFQGQDNQISLRDISKAIDLQLEKNPELIINCALAAQPKKLVNKTLSNFYPSYDLNDSNNLKYINHFANEIEKSLIVNNLFDLSRSNKGSARIRNNGIEKMITNICALDEDIKQDPSLKNKALEFAEYLNKLLHVSQPQEIKHQRNTSMPIQRSTPVPNQPLEKTPKFGGNGDFSFFDGQSSTRDSEDSKKAQNKQSHRKTASDVNFKKNKNTENLLDISLSGLLMQLDHGIDQSTANLNSNNDQLLNSDLNRTLNDTDDLINFREKESTKTKKNLEEYHKPTSNKLAIDKLKQEDREIENLEKRTEQSFKKSNGIAKSPQQPLHHRAQSASAGNLIKSIIGAILLPEENIELQRKIQEVIQTYQHQRAHSESINSAVDKNGLRNPIKPFQKTLDQMRLVEEKKRTMDLIKILVSPQKTHKKSPSNVFAGTSMSKKGTNLTALVKNIKNFETKPLTTEEKQKNAMKDINLFASDKNTIQQRLANKKEISRRFTLDKGSTLGNRQKSLYKNKFER